MGRLLEKVDCDGLVLVYMTIGKSSVLFNTFVGQSLLTVVLAVPLWAVRTRSWVTA